MQKSVFSKVILQKGRQNKDSPRQTEAKNMKPANVDGNTFFKSSLGRGRMVSYANYDLHEKM